MRAPAIRMESVAAIHVAEGRRALREDAVAPLMDSIKRLGLQVPIAIRVADEVVMPDDGEVVSNVPVLVAGRHRLEACRRLGMDAVPVVEFSSEADARLWEISENLHRAELSALERDEHIAEWERIISTQRVENPGRGRPGAAPATAKALGISASAVKQARATASLPDAAKEAARETGLDNNRAALLAAAKTADPEAAIRRRAEEKEAEDARKANRETDRLIAERRIHNITEWLGQRLDITEMHQLGEMLRGVYDPLARALGRNVA